MRYIFLIFISLILFKTVAACDHFDFNSVEDSHSVMGKKSNFYDAYKQGKCVLKEVLSPLPEEQREIIAK